MFLTVHSKARWSEYAISETVGLSSSELTPCPFQETVKTKEREDKREDEGRKEGKRSLREEEKSEQQMYATCIAFY